MKIDRTTLILVIITILVSVGVITGLRMSEKQFEKFDAEVGNQVIFRGDTLFVMDYSMFNDSYALDNGLKMDRTFYETLEKIER